MGAPFAMSDEAIVKVRMGSERNFGLVIGAVFLLIALWPLMHGGGVRAIWLGLAALLAGLGLLAPKLLEVPNKLWFRFGLLLGAIVAPIVMALVYVVVFLPIGMILRLKRADLLRLKTDPEASTYWIERETKPQSMTRQF